MAAVIVAAALHGQAQGCTLRKGNLCVSKDVASTVTQHGRVTAPSVTRSTLLAPSSARLSSIPHSPLESKEASFLICYPLIFFSCVLVFCFCLVIKNQVGMCFCSFLCVSFTVIFAVCIMCTGVDLCFMLLLPTYL